MNRFVQVAVCAALVALPTVSTAQATKSVTLGVSGGLSVPMGDISNNYSSGYNVTGHVFVTPATRKSLGFRGDVSYDNFATKSSATLFDGTFSTVGFIGNAMLHLGDAAGTKRPYLLAGAGMIRSKATRTTQSVGFSSSSTDVGIQGGAGMEFLLSGFSTFLEVKYVNGFLDNGNLNYVPITFGIKF